MHGVAVDLRVPEDLDPLAHVGDDYVQALLGPEVFGTGHRACTFFRVSSQSLRKPLEPIWGIILALVSIHLALADCGRLGETVVGIHQDFPHST